MSADDLRAAAALIRSRAEACLSRGDDWYTDHEVMGALVAIDPPSAGVVADAEHIAGADPTVMLAVAAWLDAAYADWWTRENSIGAKSVRAMSGEVNRPDPNALAVARAYLRKEAP